MPRAAELFALPTPAHRTPAPRAASRPRHDAKFTVYCSDDEVVALEHARLVLRKTFGLAVDRGRIVRAAIDAALADLDEHGAESLLVRRLRAD